MLRNNVLREKKFHLERVPILQSYRWYLAVYNANYNKK